MSLPLRAVYGLGTGILLAAAISSCGSEIKGFCGKEGNDGDEYCQDRGDGEAPYCSLCLADNHGCVATPEEVEEGCAPGADSDSGSSAGSDGTSDSGGDTSDPTSGSGSDSGGGSGTTGGSDSGGSDSGTGSGTAGSTAGTDSDSGSGTAGTTDGVECDDANPCTDASAPLCEAGACVPCGDATVQSCADINADTPACNTDGSCVQCTDSDAAACSGDTPVCNPNDNACVACTDNSTCTSVGASVCDTNACTPCSDNAGCTHLTDTPLCDVASSTCVSCLSDSDCGDVGAAKCDTTSGACVPCDADAQCAGISGAEVCDVGMGTCVECTADDQGACGGNVCDVKARECSEFEADTAGTCQPCVATRQCTGGKACVETTFDGSDAGSFCLWEQASMLPGGPNNDCASIAPYQAPRNYAPIEGGDPLAVCSLQFTTCKAFDEILDPCGADSECGVDGLADGLCLNIGGSETECTAECLDSADCGPLECNKDGSPFFCERPS